MVLPRKAIAGSVCLILFVVYTSASLAGPFEQFLNPEFSLSVSGPCGEVSVQPGSFYEQWRDVLLTTRNNPTIGVTRVRTCFETDESGDFVFTRRTGACDYGSQVLNAVFDPYARDPRNGAALTCGESLDRPDGTSSTVDCFEQSGRITEIATYGDLGAEGWSWSLIAEGAVSIIDTTTAGTVTANFRDGGIERGGFIQTSVASSLTHAGVTSVVALAQTLPVTLPPEGTEIVLRIRVQGDVPTGAGQTAEGRFWWAYREEDLLSGGGKPVDTLVVYNGRAVKVSTRGNPPINESDLIECRVVFTTESEANFVRCDANADGVHDVSDAVWNLLELFANGLKTECSEAADCNDDGARNVSDAIYALAFLFRGGAAPPPPFPGCGTVEGLPSPECPGETTVCP